MGIALIGIDALEIPVGMVAGAVISEHILPINFPLSDTTNLAPAMAGTDLFTHIRYMSYTTVPSIIITLKFFILVFFKRQTILMNFSELSAWLFIVPLLVIARLFAKLLPVALMIGTLLVVICTILSTALVLETQEQCN